MTGVGTTPMPQALPPSPSLSELHHLPCQVRFERILESGRDDLLAAIRADRRQAPALDEMVDAERLAWAVAFNVDGPPIDKPDAATRRGIRGYCDRWPHDTSWTTIWDSLTKRLDEDAKDGDCTLLSELAWSVACEHRDDWQHPRARPIDTTEANRAFEVVYASGRGKVVGDVSRAFGQRAGSPEAVADEAWSRVFCDYWSLTARRRFLGLSRISTLVCQVARYVAVDALRDQSRGDDESRVAGESSRAVPALEDLGITDDPAMNLLAEELESRIKTCMSRLPARQRIVAEMVWFRQIRAKRVAEILRVSEPAVSQHLKKAREALKQCLNRHDQSESPA